MCREHAAQLGAEYDRVRELGAEIVTIGTGDARYARAFAEDEGIAFPLLLDDDARAAAAAEIERVGPIGLFAPKSYSGAARAWKAGHRIGRPGPRTNQLGATFVVGPNSRLHYAHRDEHTADHAPMHEVLAALA